MADSEIWHHLAILGNLLFDAEVKIVNCPNFHTTKALTSLFNTVSMTLRCDVLLKVNPQDRNGTRAVSFIFQFYFQSNISRWFHFQYFQYFQYFTLVSSVNSIFNPIFHIGLTDQAEHRQNSRENNIQSFSRSKINFYSISEPPQKNILIIK